MSVGHGQLSFTNMLLSILHVMVSVTWYILFIHWKIIYSLTFPLEFGRARFMLEDISTSHGLQLSKSGKGITTLGSLAGDVDDCVSSGLVPGMPQALEMSPKAVHHWLSSMSACFGMHEYHGARVRSG